MKAADNYYEVCGEHAAFRPRGETTLAEGVKLISEAITVTREAKIRKLLVNTSELTGFPTPTVTDRYLFVHAWAKAAQGAVRIAMVAREEMIDPQKFGVMVAANIGLTTEVFTNENGAFEWLLNTKPY
ncbi:MAG: hypothetical protein JWM04_507 [Verrucomicrobiales bacterium]|nr:hypothetical protein [Verrucomicrobiales bacterium]